MDFTLEVFEKENDPDKQPPPIAPARYQEDIFIS
jgi:hypothetical protein